MASRESLERFNNELGLVFTPYTGEQLNEKRSSRKFITALAEFNTRIWYCIYFAEDVIDYIDKGDYAHAFDCFRKLDVGNQFDKESLCAVAIKVRDHIIAKGEGGGPISRSVIDFTRALATIIRLHIEIHSSDAIIDADRAARDIAHMLTSHDITCGDSGKFGDYVNKTFDNLLSSLSGHYAKTANFLGAKVERQHAQAKPKEDPKTEKIVNAVEGVNKSLADIKIAVADAGTKVAKAVRKAKAKGRKPKVSVKTQEAVWNIHERVKQLAAVKDMHSRGIATRENEFKHAKAELRALDIMTSEQYRYTLKIRSCRISKANSRRP